MKTKLLLFIFTCLFLTLGSTAQEYTWDFGNDTDNFPETSGYATTTVVNGLTIEPGGSSFGTIEPNSGTWDDGYSSINRFKYNGNSGVDPSDGVTFMPTRRYLAFDVDGPVSVKIWFRASGTSLPRALWVTDGSSEVYHYDSLGDTDRRYIEGNYTGGAGTLYVLCAGNAFNLYKIVVSSTLSTDDVSNRVSASLKAIGTKVSLSNVESNTSVEIYTITGSLVKTIQSNEDTSFTLNPGIYIALLKSPQGQKSVKLITH